MTSFKTFIINKIELLPVRKSRKILNKYFHRKEGNITFPEESNLLKLTNIYAESYDKINESSGRINIKYTVDMEFHVSTEIKETLTVFHIGSIFCAGIKILQKIDQVDESDVMISFFSRARTIRFPVANQPSLKIVCRKLILEEFGRFVLDDGKLIPLSDELNILGYQANSLMVTQESI